MSKRTIYTQAAALAGKLSRLAEAQNKAELEAIGRIDLRFAERRRRLCEDCEPEIARMAEALLVAEGAVLGGEGEPCD